MTRAWALIGMVIGVLVPMQAGAQLVRGVYATGFTQPLAFVQDPTDRSVQFVVQQGGRIRIVRNGTVLPEDFLDLTGKISSGGERGLLGLAFPPDATSTGRFFVNFTDPAGNTVIARFTRSSNPLVANPNSRFDIRIRGQASIGQPYANHNGGNLAFGPDGYLYIGLGDGGSGDDPENRAQDPNQLLGKMLRIDVNVPATDPLGYVVPGDNPFLHGPIAALPEIWAFGLRNPWRYSFDDVTLGGTGALLIADVGQNQYEEIDYQPAAQGGGRNYGWRVREGAHDNVTSPPAAYLPLVDPIFEYNHSVGQSITGGFVYRGRGLGPNYRGRYFFADYISARVWSLLLSTSGTGSDLREHTADFGGSGEIGNVSSFGVDADGEIYIVSHSRGMIFKILPPVPGAPTGLHIVQ